MPLQDRISTILNSAETHAARSVNSAHVLANWLIGREIIIEEQEGKERATYGEKVIPKLAKRLKELKIKGYSAANLWLCRQFHLSYSNFIQGSINQTLLSQFQPFFTASEILDAPRRESLNKATPILDAPRG